MMQKSSHLSPRTRRWLILLVLALPLSLILVAQGDCLCGCSQLRASSTVNVTEEVAAQIAVNVGASPENQVENQQSKGINESLAAAQHNEEPEHAPRQEFMK